jgi:hypothetical protein
MLSCAAERTGTNAAQLEGNNVTCRQVDLVLPTVLLQVCPRGANSPTLSSFCPHTFS